MLNSLDSFLLCPQGGRFWHVPQVQNEEDLCLHSPSGEQMDFCTPSGQHHRVSSWIHQIMVVDQRGANITDQDVVSWCWTTDGMYTTRSTYKAMFWGSYSSTCSQTFWKALAENKVKKFCWHLSLGRILPVDKLIQRGWQGSEICSMCSSQEESVEHLLLNCYFARQVWRRIAAWSCFDSRHYDVKMASGRARCTPGGWSEPAKSLRPTSESLMGLLLTQKKLFKESS